MVNIIIYGRIPSKKNSVIAMCRGGRAIHIPSNEYRKWHRDAEIQLRGIRKPDYKYTDSLSITIYPPDKRKGDLTNKAESIMDLLVDIGVLEDDNWYVIPRLQLQFGAVDKEKPRAEITIN